MNINYNSSLKIDSREVATSLEFSCSVNLKFIYQKMIIYYNNMYQFNERRWSMSKILDLVTFYNRIESN